MRSIGTYSGLLDDGRPALIIRAHESIELLRSLRSRLQPARDHALLHLGKRDDARERLRDAYDERVRRALWNVNAVPPEHLETCEPRFGNCRNIRCGGGTLT